MHENQMINMLYPIGVNSAVMLMNLTKMREFKWTEYMGPILNKFELNLTWGDQDIINIIFHYHPGTYIRFSSTISFLSLSIYCLIKLYYLVIVGSVGQSY